MEWIKKILLFYPPLFEAVKRIRASIRVSPPSLPPPPPVLTHRVNFLVFLVVFMPKTL